MSLRASLLALPLLLSACGEGEDDTSGTDTDTDTDSDSDSDTDTEPSDLDEDGWTVEEGDCDDFDPSRHPGAEEVCDNGVDDDCDGGHSPCRPEGVMSASDVATHTKGSGGTAFGFSLHAGVDLTDDGAPDLLVGAPEDDRAIFSAGSAALYAGPFDDLGTATVHTLVRGTERDHLVGSSVLLLGDITGDGEPDLALGAPGDEDARDNGGAVYIYAGPFAGGVIDSTADVGRIYGGDTKDYAGRVLASAGDLDGDGTTDLYIPAPETTNDKPGKVQLVYGPVTGDIDLDDVTDQIVGEGNLRRVGRVVVPVGDLDGDGRPDLVLSLSDLDDTGAIHLVVHDAAPSGTVGVTAGSADIDGGTAFLEDQATIAAPGDVDGDGRDDLWVGAPSQLDLTANQGAGLLFTGPLSGDLQPSDAVRRVEGTESGQWLGVAAGALGDVDGDGQPDLALTDNEGTVYVIYGHAEGTTTVEQADNTLTSPATAERFGTWLVGPGDLSGDGRDDWLIGAPGRATNGDTGTVWLVLGSTI